MKNAPARSALVLVMLLSASAVNAHGLHLQELQHNAGGIMDELLHLFAAHGYWALFLLAGLATMAHRTGLFHRRRRKERSGNHPHDQQQHKY